MTLDTRNREGFIPIIPRKSKKDSHNRFRNYLDEEQYHSATDLLLNDPKLLREVELYELKILLKGLTSRI